MIERHWDGIAAYCRPENKIALGTPWQEQVCAENPVEHYEDEWIGLPRADHPDF
jgi:hypothetical protein